MVSLFTESAMSLRSELAEPSSAVVLTVRVVAKDDSTGARQLNTRAATMSGFGKEYKDGRLFRVLGFIILQPYLGAHTNKRNSVAKSVTEGIKVCERTQVIHLGCCCGPGVCKRVSVVAERSHDVSHAALALVFTHIFFWIFNLR
jgi:hypothetical protein